MTDRVYASLEEAARALVELHRETHLPDWRQAPPAEQAAARADLIRRCDAAAAMRPKAVPNVWGATRCKDMSPEQYAAFAAAHGVRLPR